MSVIVKWLTHFPFFIKWLWFESFRFQNFYFSSKLFLINLLIFRVAAKRRFHLISGLHSHSAPLWPKCTWPVAKHCLENWSKIWILNLKNKKYFLDSGLASTMANWFWAQQQTKVNPASIGLTPWNCAWTTATGGKWSFGPANGQAPAFSFGIPKVRKFF